jgi:hypothetical protein
VEKKKKYERETSLFIDFNYSPDFNIQIQATGNRKGDMNKHSPQKSGIQKK